MPDYGVTYMSPQERAQLVRVTLIVEYFECFRCSHGYIVDMTNMRNLRELVILTVEGLIAWGNDLGGLPDWFESRFGKEEGYVCPRIRIFDEETGDELNQANSREKSLALRGRYRHRGRRGSRRQRRRERQLRRGAA